jgi:hypothetical protein
MLSLPECGLLGVPRCARNAAPRAPKRAGTKPTLSTPMSPPVARQEAMTVRDRPRASISTMSRPTSSGDQLASIAIEGTRRGRDAALHPGCRLCDRADGAPAVDRKDGGGTFDPRGHQRPKRPTSSNVIPLGNVPAGSPAKGRAWPSESTTTTPGGSPRGRKRRRAEKRSVRPGPRRRRATARYASASGRVTYPPGAREKVRSVPPRLKKKSWPPVVLSASRHGVAA